MRWTQERDVPKLRYNSAKDPKGRGWHYIWEGGGFGVQVYASGMRKWVQCGHAWNPGLQKRQPYFRLLGNLDQVKLADARTAAGRIKADAKDGSLAPPEKRTTSGAQSAPATSSPDHERPSSLADTTLNDAITYYVNNRNCAPTSKYTLAVVLRKHLADWLQKPLLSVDTIMLQQRYKLVLRKVKARGDALDARYESMAPKERLGHAPAGYHSGVKTAHDIVEGFGRVYRYWTTKHQTLLQRAGVLVPICPTTALVDDIEPQPQRVKSVPADSIRRLLASFPSYPGNQLHPLLMRLLLASGMRVGVALGCKRFNDVPTLVGSNSGEGAGTAPPNTTAKSFLEIGKDAPQACAPKIAAVVARYAHDTDAAAVKSFEDLSRDSDYGWNSWTWARLHARKGRSKVFVYYFDVSPPDSTVGAYHGAEVQYVFGRPSAVARMDDARVSDLMRRYWINLPRAVTPMGQVCPRGRPFG